MAVDTFKPINQTISEIFSCDGIYKIPNYQRQYSWTDDQLDSLWNDLYEAYQNKSEENDCYFLGSIVVVNDGKGYYELIDGQQRITTLMILMNVLYRNFPDVNKDSDEIFVADKEKILNSILFQGRRNRLQLQTDPKYDVVFKNLISDKESFEGLKKPTKKEMKLDTPEYKYINSAYFFYEKLNELDEEDLNGFINYIFFSTNIIKIECTNQSFAIKLFQVLNDRGLDLSPSDIVKSYIIGKYDNDNEIGKRTFENTWKEIEDLSKNNGFKIDDFVVYYEYYKLKTNPKKQVVDELRRIIEESDVEELVSDMNLFAKSLSKVLSSVDPVILSLRYIPWRFYVMTALTSAYQVDYPDKENLFRLIRKYFYVSLISGCTLNGIKQTSFKIIEYIVDKHSINDIEKEIQKSIASRKMIKKTYEALDDEVFNEKFLKPLMLSLEYEIRERTNTTFYPIDNNLHMDHILPRAYSKKEAWDYITDEVKPYINTLGNMALLLSDKNEEALNCGFDEKKRIYKGLDKDGNLATGVTTFETSRVVIEKAEWDLNTIKERKEYLINLIEKMLNISVEDINIKIEEDNTSTRNANSKWLYNENYYDNTKLVRALITDYIIDNNITNYEVIPDDIKNFKMHYHELIINENNNLLENNYSYTKMEINNFEIYVRSICKIGNTEDFINLMTSKYGYKIDRLQYINI